MPNFKTGENRQNAKMSNQDVSDLLELRLELGWGYKRLAAKFEISPRTVRRYIREAGVKYGALAAARQRNGG